jgi:hypothetical protein
MTAPVPVPLALVEGFASVWCRLAGGTWERLETPAGTVVAWTSRDGQSEALPDRMYGLVNASAACIDPGDLPSGLAVNLPPGVTAEGAELHAVGHQLVAQDRDSAWASLRRVGRQGVLKAQRVGCAVSDLSDDQYLALARAKAARFDSRAPHAALLPGLRDAFGADCVGLSGVAVDGQPASAVLWLKVGDYGVLVDGASDRAHWDKNPNNLAVWTAIGQLIDAGCHRVDYGFSAPGAGDLRFKDHMGGREVPLYRASA